MRFRAIRVRYSDPTGERRRLRDAGPKVWQLGVELDYRVWTLIPAVGFSRFPYFLTFWASFGPLRVALEHIPVEGYGRYAKTPREVLQAAGRLWVRFAGRWQAVAVAGAVGALMAAYAAIRGDWLPAALFLFGVTVPCALGLFAQWQFWRGWRCDG